MSIKQVVYVSQEAVSFDRTRLKALLNNAREKNKRANVTGVLLHSPGLFAQCIEGKPALIDTLFAKILADPRHTNVVRLQEITLPQRCFSDWSMGCVDVSASEILELKGAEWQKAIEDHKGRSWISPGFVLMEGLWEMHRARQF